MPPKYSCEIIPGKASDDILLMTGMVFGDFLKDKHIKFNPRPFTDESPSSPLPHRPQPPDVDLHWDIAEKVDRLIEEHEHLNQMEEQVSMPHRPEFLSSSPADSWEPLKKETHPSSFNANFETPVGTVKEHAPEFTIKLSTQSEDAIRFIHSFDDQQRPVMDETVILPESNKFLVEKLLGDTKDQVATSSAFFVATGSSKSSSKSASSKKKTGTTSSKITDELADEEKKIATQKKGLKSARENVEKAQKNVEKKKKKVETIEKKTKGKSAKNGLVKARSELKAAKDEVSKKQQELEKIENQVKQQEQVMREKHKELKRKEQERKRKVKEESHTKISILYKHWRALAASSCQWQSWPSG
jgi:hypothetical protein